MGAWHSGSDVGNGNWRPSSWPRTCRSLPAMRSARQTNQLLAENGFDPLVERLHTPLLLRLPGDVVGYQQKHLTFIFSGTVFNGPFAVVEPFVHAVFFKYANGLA